MTAGHPQAFGQGEQPGEWLDLADPAVIEQVDYTLGAVDTEGLQTALLRHLIKERIVSAEKAAELFQEPMLDEKALRDRSQFLLGGVLPSNFFRTSGLINYQGFEGYIGLAGRVRRVREIGTAESSSTDRGGIRNDIAETETVEDIATRKDSIGLRTGVTLGFGRWALSLTPLAIGSESSHSVSSAVQAQPKTAVVHHGSQRRFQAVLRIDVEVHAEPGIVWDLARIAGGRLRSEPLTIFSVDVPAEILIPETQADRFLSAIGAVGPGDRQPAAEADAAATTGQDRADARARFMALFRQPTARAARHWMMRTMPLGHLLLSTLDFGPLVGGTPLFPPGGLASETALVAHLAATGDPVTLYVPHDYGLERHFTAPQMDSLGALQAAHRLWIFTAPGPDLVPEELEILPEQAEQPEQPGDIQLVTPSRGRTTRRRLTEEHQTTARGYALDGAGVSHGWYGQAGEANPARPQAAQSAATEQPADPRADQAPRTQYRGLLADTSLPASGVITNLAGVPVWGWVPAGAPEWGAGESEQRQALIGLLRQAGRSGLQLVVDPASSRAGQLLAAVAGRHDLTHDQWSDFWERSGRALENRGAGLEGLSRDELLRVLVTDRNVRIVDENGVVRDELNARLISVAADGRPRYLTGSVALAPGEEYALRADGKFSRSISWDEQGLIVAHVRRAVSPSDPATETPELAAGLGLGTAVVKELPGADKVYQTARSIILDMINDLPLGGRARGFAPGAGRSTRYASLGAAEQARLDRRLQEAFSLPKLRAVRSRGLDTHLHMDIEVARRDYRVNVGVVKLGGDRPEDREAYGPGPARDPGHEDRGHQRTRSERGVAVDHQAKGMRAGGELVGRSAEAGAEVGVSYRWQTPNPAVAADFGDATGSVSYTGAEFLAITGAAKHYLRLRSRADEVFRPDYPLRYHVSVTEISRRWDGSEHTRTASRIIGPDEASLPAIVHPAFRPSEVITRGLTYEGAYRDAVATMGRTTELSQAQYLDLERRRLDFGQVGSAGLNVFVTGLRDAARQAALLVEGHARDRAAGQRPESAGRAGYVRTNPAVPWKHVPEIDMVVTEGFLRANLPRLLAGEGVPVPLPAEDRRFAEPRVSGSLTMHAFLVPADDAIDHQAPQASNESYVEDDIKITAGQSTTWRAGLSFSFGPTVELSLPSATTKRSGGSAEFLAARGDARLVGRATGPGGQGRPSPGGPGSPSGSSINSRRAVRSRVGVTADGTATVNLYSSNPSRTTGTIDLGLLTEPMGQHVTRAHLVLRFDSARQPRDAGLLGVRIGGQSITERFFGPGALSFSQRTTYLLVENAVELYKSDTLHRNLQRIGSGGQGRPALEGPASEGSALKGKGREGQIAVDVATGYAAGFPLRFDVSRVRFTDEHPQLADQEPVAVAGLIPAIAAGLRATGLVGEEYLNDTSAFWRAITATYDAEAVRTHLHDLLGVGIIHRANIPVSSLLTLAGVRRVTIVVTGAARELRHVGSRDSDSVTFGGQALAQHGHDSENSLSGGLSVNLDGRYSANQRSYLEGTMSAGAEGETSVSIGSESVVRDIRRSAGSGPSEEFVGELGLRVEIFADTEQIEPLRKARAQATSVRRNLQTASRPVRYNNSWWASWLAEPTAADAGSAALVTLVSGTDALATARLVIPKSLTTAGPPDRQRITPAVLPPLGGMPQAHLLDYELGKRFLALQFPDLEWVARWAPTTTLPRRDAHSRFESHAPATVTSLSPTTDQGHRMLQALGNRFMRDNVAGLFTQRLSLTETAGIAITLGARSGVLKRLSVSAGDYSGLIFREEAEEPTVVVGGTSARRVTLAAGGGNANVSSVPEFLVRERQSGRSFRGFNGDYREFNESFRNRAYLYGGPISYDITGPHGYHLTILSGGQFSGLLLEPWAMQLAQDFPSRVVHPYATELPAEQDARTRLIEELLKRPARADGENLADGEPVRLLADAEGDSESIEAARSLAVRLEGRASVQLAVADASWKSHQGQLRRYFFSADNLHVEGRRAYQDLLALRTRLQDLERRAAALADQPDTSVGAPAGPPAATGSSAVADGPGEDRQQQLAAVAKEIDKNREQQKEREEKHKESVVAALTLGDEDTDAAELSRPLVRSAGAEDPLNTAWQAVGAALVLPSNSYDVARARQLPSFPEVTNVLISGVWTSTGTLSIRGRELSVAELAGQIADRLMSEVVVRSQVVLYVPNGEDLARTLSHQLVARGQDVTVIFPQGSYIRSNPSGGSGIPGGRRRWIAYQAGMALNAVTPQTQLEELVSRIRGFRVQQAHDSRRPRMPVIEEGDEQ